MTASTLDKELLFDGRELLDELQRLVLTTFTEAGWNPQAWAFFPNHYHVVMFHEAPPESLDRTVAKAHSLSTKALNVRAHTSGRRAWYRYWDSHLTFERSYLARLAYVHDNPRRHGVVTDSQNYSWCSMRWFQEKGDVPFVRTVVDQKLDRIHEREIEIGDWSP